MELRKAETEVDAAETEVREAEKRQLDAVVRSGVEIGFYFLIILICLYEVFRGLNS